MILTCPACGTKYTVKDGAIPPGGRQVRCANCKHSWHQDPEESAGPFAAETPAAPADPVLSETPTAPSFAPPPASSDPSGAGHWGDRDDPQAENERDLDASPLPEAAAPPIERGWDEEEPAAPAHAEPQVVTGADETEDRTDEREPLPYVVAHEPGLATPAMPAGEESGWVAPATATPGIDPVDMDFAAYDSGREEFSGGRGKLLLGLLAALALIVAAVAAFWFLAPASFKERLGLAAPGETLLKVQVDQRSRRTLASGQQVLEVSGKVINPSDQAQAVPPLQAQLRSLDQQVVYRWTIPAPAQTLQPGASASFNSAELNIPASAACLDVSLDKNQPALRKCEADAANAG